MAGMLRPAPIRRRGVRDEAALHQARRPRRATGATSRGAPLAQGVRARLPADGVGYIERDDGRPDAVRIARVSADRALLPQSDGRSDLYGIGFGNRAAHRPLFMNKLALPMFTAACAAAWAVAGAAAPPATPKPSEGQGLTLEKIMADPDWMGPPVKDAYWSADGRAVYYSVKRAGSTIVDLHHVDLAGQNDRVVDAKGMADADAAAVFDRSLKRAAFVRNGDIFVRDLSSGRLRQITRSPQIAAAPQFSADGKRLSFRVGNDWFINDFDTGVTAPAAIVKAEKDPDAPPKADDLRDMQLRTFSTLKRLHEESEAGKKHAEEMRKGDATRSAAPFYLGEDVAIRDTELSPDARWLLVVTTPKSAAKGFEGKLTRYVTESGYEEFETERVRVGRNPPAAQSLLLLNLVDHTVHALSVDNLPGIHDDPLKAVREENGKHDGEAEPSAGKDARPQRRDVDIVPDDPDRGRVGIVWSRDGGALAIRLLSMDHKDCWIVTVDLSTYALVPQHRVTDPAWINLRFSQL